MSTEKYTTFTRITRGMSKDTDTVDRNLSILTMCHDVLGRTCSLMSSEEEDKSMLKMRDD